MKKAAFVACLAMGAFPRCSCDPEQGIGRASVEINMTLTEIDACAGVAVTRRIPDDYERISSTTDFGSVTERVFEIRSIGNAPLDVSEVLLDPPDPEFSIVVVDTQGQPAALPLAIPPDGRPDAPADLLIRVLYTAQDSEPDASTLVVRSNDSDRSEISFDLSAGRGRLEVCGTNGCDAPEIQFGPVAQLGERTEQLVLRNSGVGEIRIQSIELASDSAEFCAKEATVLPPGVLDCAPVDLCRVLRPDESYTVNIRYRPRDPGADSGWMRINSTDAVSGTVEVPINGVGAGPAICVCELEGEDCAPVDRIDFGGVEVGAEATRRVRLLSCGTNPVELSEALLETDPQTGYATDSAFDIVSGFPLGLLPPGAFSEGEIRYAPTAPGAHRGGLRFSSERSTGWAPIAGRAASCDLMALPGTVDFGAVAGATSADRVVLLANNGAAACTVTDFSELEAPFEVVNSPPMPFTIDGGDAFEVTVRYTAPIRPSPAPDMGLLEVYTDEPPPANRHAVALRAVGGGEAICDIEIQPSGAIAPGRHGVLRFGTVAIGYSKTLPILISNSGNAPCTMMSLSERLRAPGEFTVTPAGSVPAQIDPGARYTVEVTFSPTTGMTDLGLGYTPLANYVEFGISGPNFAATVYKIGISAVPTVPTIDILPEAIDFGVVTWANPRPSDNRSSCGSETRALRIYNSGNGPLRIASIYLDPSSDAYFEVVSVTNGGTNVAAPYTTDVPAGGNAEVQLRFFPTRFDPSEHHGLLVVENDVTTESTVPLLGEGTVNQNQTDVFEQVEDNLVDILWVIDDSGSMSDEQSDLATNFEFFANFAETLGADWQLGVTTTESRSEPAGKLWACNGYSKVISSGDPNRVDAFRCAANVTNPPGGNRRPNPGGSDSQEAGLQAARMALEPPIRDTENAGFLRDDARLAVIVVSDEDDQSMGPVNLYVDFFRNLKGFRNPQLMSLSAIAGDVPSGCATAEAGLRYHDASQQLGGEFESVCNSDWRSMLMNIGLDVFELRHTWTLSRPADPSTLSVTVDGVVVRQGGADGFGYSAADNTVSFFGASIPVPGARIEVQYTARCLP